MCFVWMTLYTMRVFNIHVSSMFFFLGGWGVIKKYKDN